MATVQFNNHSWSKTLSLDRYNSVFHKKDESLYNLQNKQDLPSIINEVMTKKSTFLYSQEVKKSIVESRKAFLNSSHDEPVEEYKEEKPLQNVPDYKKTRAQKISFKIKKTSSIYRKQVPNAQKPTTLNATTVAELTVKFNQMVHQKDAILEEPKFRKLARRVNSFKNINTVENVKLVKQSVMNIKDPIEKINKKPSVKTKPSLDDKKLVILKNKSLVHRNENESKESEKHSKNITDENNVNAKLNVLKSPTVPNVGPPRRPNTLPISESPSTSNISPSIGSVKATIQIFERRNSESATIIVKPEIATKPKVAERKKKPKTFQENFIGKAASNSLSEQNTGKTEFESEEVQIVSIKSTLPQKNCYSTYEMSNLRNISQFRTCSEDTTDDSKTVDETEVTCIKPNSSFLWNRTLSSSSQSSKKEETLAKDIESIEEFYDPVETQDNKSIPEVPPRPANLIKPGNTLPRVSEQVNLGTEEKIYEELELKDDGYEYCSTRKYVESDKSDDGYEYCASPDKENIYEVLPSNPISSKRQDEPLPPRPPSRNSNCTIQSGEVISNCYESIYSTDLPEIKIETDSTYESIYCYRQGGGGSNRDSLVSSDQHSNSLYGRTGPVWNEENLYNGTISSDRSSTDRSDDWVDLSDNEDNPNISSGVITVWDRPKPKKIGGWSQQFQQWTKSSKPVGENGGLDSDFDHHYESLHTTSDVNQDLYDSFDSDTESETSFTKVTLNDSGVDVGNSQLPDPPNTNYVLTRLAATAGKHMKKFKKNFSLTKNDITKSFSKMTRRMSKPEAEFRKSSKDSLKEVTRVTPADEAINQEIEVDATDISYANYYIINNHQTNQMDDNTEKSKSLTRRGFLDKIRRSISLSADSAAEITSALDDKPKSTFYLTDVIDIEKNDSTETDASENTNGSILAPQTSPTSNSPGSQSSPSLSPTPPNSLEVEQLTKTKRTRSLYAEVGLFKSSENKHLPRRPSTCWYAEVGLYPKSSSTPSSSSAENSGNNTQLIIKSFDNVNQDNNEEYNNLKNNSSYYNNSISSFNSNSTKKDLSMNSLTGDLDIQLRLQDEPLYQFYDAAVSDSACKDGISDVDSDNYEDVENKREIEIRRPSAMELVAPKRNSLAITRTLWCEVPEVIQSTVLSSLSTHQKKLQEAKFEMVTSEASYLNSLHVLSDHFLKNLQNNELITKEENESFFGNILKVKESSSKLLLDLEKCWQENILLHGVCDIVQKHAEENFSVYIPYCENQISLEHTLRKLKENPLFNETLKHLEGSSICQALSLYSFVMLPMQRITRWPLLVDAVLKRLSPDDEEYVTCQYALATINKIVHQCNEAARKREREIDMFKVTTQLEFSKGVAPIDIVTASRWLVRSGMVTHMQARNDETKLTFGKKFIKTPLSLFLFNDLLIVAKAKSDSAFSIIHYCPRNLVELNNTDLLVSVPTKDTTGKHLIFLTLLENQEEKTMEFLLSCNSESDKERWIEAFAPPQSDDPRETLYECWDCPQVLAIHNFIASQPDELALTRGDVINVLRKMDDGWYHGERMRDGQIGWFPGNYTKEVANPHVRARNLKQRYRLLAFSENYLKTK